MHQTLAVLHLDDDPFEREFVERELGPAGGAEGILVTSVASAVEFNDVLGRCQPDLVILDYRLDETPGSPTGLDLVAHVRTQCPGAVIFILSSTTDAAARRQASALAIDAFLAKDVAAPVGAAALSFHAVICAAYAGAQRRRRLDRAE